MLEYTSVPKFVFGKIFFFFAWSFMSTNAAFIWLKYSLKNTDNNFEKLSGAVYYLLYHNNTNRTSLSPSVVSRCSIGQLRRY